MRHSPLHRVISIMIIMLMIVFSFNSVARELVLIGNTFSIDRSFSKSELRKLFLGYRVTRDDNAISAIRNIHSDDLYQAFLQKVMFMSKTSYERRGMALNFSKGNSKVEQEKDQKKIIRYLRNDAYKISVMWRDDFQAEGDLGVIQVLWSGEIQ